MPQASDMQVRVEYRGYCGLSQPLYVGNHGLRYSFAAYVFILAHG